MQSQSAFDPMRVTAAVKTPTGVLVMRAISSRTPVERAAGTQLATLGKDGPTGVFIDRYGLVRW